MGDKKTALVVIDVQCGILDLPNLQRKRESDRALDETVGRITGLIERARSSSAPVIYIQHDGGRGHRLGLASSARTRAAVQRTGDPQACL